MTDDSTVGWVNGNIRYFPGSEPGAARPARPDDSWLIDHLSQEIDGPGAVDQLTEGAEDWDSFRELVNSFSIEQRRLWLRSRGVPEVYLDDHLGDMARARKEPWPPEASAAARPAGASGPSGLDAWRDWGVWMSAQFAPKTVHGYKGTVLRFLAETGCRAPGDYTSTDVAAFIVQHAPKNSRYSYSNALKSFFGWARRNRLAPDDVTEDLRLKKPRRLPPEVLSEEELVRILIAAVFRWGERVGWALLLIYSMGLRRSEAAGLRWDDIQQGETGPMIQIRESKGGARPPLPLSPLALECLGHLQELPADPRTTVGPEYILRARAFSITQWSTAAGALAGVPRGKRGAHRLRATTATRLLRDGVDVGIVQRILGHLRLESTSWYLEIPDDNLTRDALGRLGPLR